MCTPDYGDDGDDGDVNDDENTLFLLSRSRRGPPRARATLHHLDGAASCRVWSRTATDTPLESSARRWPMAAAAVTCTRPGRAVVRATC